MDWILWVLGTLAVFWVVGRVAEGKGTSPGEHSRPQGITRNTKKPETEEQKRLKQEAIDRWLSKLTTVWAGDCSAVEFTYHAERRKVIPKEVLQDPESDRLYIQAYCPHEQMMKVFAVHKIETKILMRSKRYTHEEWLRKVIGDELYDSVTGAC